MSELAEARRQADSRRRALLTTVNELQGKAMPLAVALHDGLVAVERAKRRSERLASDALRVAKEPKTISAVIAVATAMMSFALFRRFRQSGARSRR